MANETDQSGLSGEVPQAKVESLQDAHIIHVAEAQVLGPAEEGTLEAQIESTYPLFTHEDWKSPPRLLLKALAYLLIGPFVLVLYTLPKLLCKKTREFGGWVCDMLLLLVMYGYIGVVTACELFSYGLERFCVCLNFTGQQTVKFILAPIWVGVILIGRVIYKYIFVPIASAALLLWRGALFLLTKLNEYVLTPTYNGFMFVASALWDGLSWLLRTLWRGPVYVWECFTALCSLIYQHIYLPVWNGLVWAYFKIYDFVVFVCGFLFKALYWTIVFPMQWLVTKFYEYLALPLYNTAVYLKSIGYQYLALPLYNAAMCLGSTCYEYLILPVYNGVLYFVVHPAAWLFEQAVAGIMFVSETCYTILYYLVFPVYKILSDLIQSVLNALSRLFRAISRIFGV
eukprot:CAMPEP_0197559488 /NCGR_PEP_ID=MMETSP1320-20131121/21343_1 /TAXON_ID=91990 /ORGANISM="Bolidomonas sp., Strain RCC2347" /LENGTH=398 /DNA_ID=CAMNT_0043120931 /DNA_START=100 /DNA_END=1292 /DNA_ORIENTATION=-